MMSALSLLLVGCTEAPSMLRIVSGPPDANEQVAALLVRASEEVEPSFRLSPGAAVADADAALAAVTDGSADLAIVENSPSYRFPAVRTVAPLYPSVLHIGVRPDKRGQTLAEALNGATVFAGDEQAPSRQLLERIKSMYAWRGIEFSYVASLDNRPDVVVLVAPLSPRSAPLLDGYELLSVGRAEDVGAGSAADGLSLVAPFLRTFVIPEGTYGPMTPTAVATVALDTLLVTREDVPVVAIYDLIQSLLSIGPLLAAQRPDLAIDEIETFDLSHVTFPVHGGTMAHRARNDPGFAERASSIFEMGVTIAVALFTSLFALLRFLRGLRKGRIDKFYAAALAIRSKLADEQSVDQRLRYMAELRALRDDAFAQLMNEKLSADDSFRILQALIYDVIRECQTPLRGAADVASPPS
jgi:TRAP-type uncharacterized transport system substrate-binding protein